MRRRISLTPSFTTAESWVHYQDAVLLLCLSTLIQHSWLCFCVWAVGEGSLCLYYHPASSWCLCKGKYILLCESQRLKYKTRKRSSIPCSDNNRRTYQCQKTGEKIIHSSYLRDYRQCCWKSAEKSLLLIWRQFSSWSFFFPFFLSFSSAPILPAGQRIPSPGWRVSRLRVWRHGRLHHCSECTGRAHSGGLWDDEPGFCDGGVQSWVLLLRTGAVPSAVCLVSQKPLLQRRGVRGHSAWLQVSSKGSR